jgi:hypothetical protein
MVPALALAQAPLIRISKIPDNLTLPLPDGVNLLLTATVAGPRPAAVWLATAPDAASTVPLEQVSATEYQVNLADPRVLAALRQSGRAGQFRIYARLAGGPLVEALPVRYAIRPAETSPVRFELVTADRRRPIERSETTSNWTAPDEAQRIEIAVEEKPTSPAAEARAGTKAWPFRAVDRRTLALDITPELRQAWQQDGALTVRWGESNDARLALKAVPDRLDFKGSSITLTMVQGTAVEVPGSRGFIWIKIGDITGWRMLLTLSTVLRENLIEATSVREGGRLSFAVGREKYDLEVVDIKQSLINDDIAVLRITRVGPAQKPAAAAATPKPAASTPASKTPAASKPTPSAATPTPKSAAPASPSQPAPVLSPGEARTMPEAEKIERMLKMIEASDTAFIREGQEYKSQDAVAHLRKKLGLAGSRVTTLQIFIDELASKSSITGKPYQVKLADGKVVGAREWLWQKAVELGLK